MRKGLKPSRRHFLAVAAGSVISPRVALAQSSRQVACLTDWLHQEPDCGFAVTKEKGFYSERHQQRLYRPP